MGPVRLKREKTSTSKQTGGMKEEPRVFVCCFPSLLDDGWTFIRA